MSILPGKSVHLSPPRSVGVKRDCSNPELQPCTAPTPEQVIEEQGREIARLLSERESVNTQLDALMTRGNQQIADLRAQLQTAEQREKELGEQLEFDRTAVADCLTKANNAIDSRYWLTEGRGCYEWNDDRWHDEFRAAAVEIKESIEPLTKIAANWKDCPQKAEDVAKARINLKARISELEQALQASQQEAERLTKERDDARADADSWSSHSLEFAGRANATLKKIRSTVPAFTMMGTTRVVSLESYQEMQGIAGAALSAPSAPQGEQPAHGKDGNGNQFRDGTKMADKESLSVAESLLTEKSDAKEYRCTLCNGLAEWDASQSVWRHMSGDPLSDRLIEQSFCDKYGYPIDVRVAATPAVEHPDTARMKWAFGQGHEVSPQELPTDLRLFRLERIIADLESRIEQLESRDSARGLSGILIGGKPRGSPASPRNRLSGTPGERSL